MRENLEQSLFSSPASAYSHLLHYRALSRALSRWKIPKSVEREGRLARHSFSFHTPSLLGLFFLLAPLLFSLPSAHATPDPGASSFFPTWKLMDYNQKKAFLSGYMFGRRDAAYVTELASSYIKENPAKAIQSLESIRSLYQVGEISPENLVPLIDTFYSDPENQVASLSKAVSAASQLGN